MHKKDGHFFARPKRTKMTVFFVHAKFIIHARICFTAADGRRRVGMETMREGLEEYARSLDLSVDEVLDLLESVFAGEVTLESAG
jgi:hypothetical protein